MTSTDRSAPAPIRPAWLHGYWAGTDDDTLRELLDSVEVLPVPRQTLFVRSIRDELARRADAPRTPDAAP